MYMHRGIPYEPAGLVHLMYVGYGGRAKLWSVALFLVFYATGTEYLTKNTKAIKKRRMKRRDVVDI